MNISGISDLVSLRAAQLNKLALNQALHRLATGQRINSAADNPAGLIASLSMDATVAALDAESSANQRAINIADTADGALGQISSMLNEANTLNLANADSGLSAEEKQANQVEIDAIISSANRIAKTTSFNGQKLLSGDATISASGAKFKISAVSVGTDVSAAIKQVATLRGQIGAFSKNTLGPRLTQIAKAKENMLATVSLIRDADYAVESAARVRSQLLERSSFMLLHTSSHSRKSIISLLA